MTTHLASRVAATAVAPSAPIRLGVVSFVNTLPLIEGLDRLAGLELHRTVPSRLIGQLLHGEADLALCSSIDYQRSAEPLVIVPAGLLGSDGPTLTVRVYSTTPIDRIERVYCDTDSHTSVVLLQILLRERFGRTVELVDYDAREHVAENRPIDWPEAMLLIGDKVVTDSPPAVRYPHQLDLGAAWAELTGLPFVFATWMARADADASRIRTAAAILDRQRRRNRDRIGSMIHRTAVPRGWPRDLAASYLGKKLVYEFTDRCRAGLETFFDKAREHGLIGEGRNMVVFDS